jgi:DNA-binding transcriptional LysR family regulator
LCLVQNHEGEIIACIRCDEYAREGLFVAAADVTGLSKTAVSRHIGNLEQRLGVRLLQRTSRRLSLTDEGRTFFTRVKDVLGAIDEAESELTARSI